MLHGVVGAKVNSVVVWSRVGVLNPLLPVGVNLLGGADIDDKGVRVPGLGGEPRVEERIVHPVPTMVFKCDHASSSVMKAQAEVIADGLATKPGGA